MHQKIMPSALKLLLLSIVFPFVALAQSIGGFNYETAFDFVEDDMPEAFEVGQSVLFQFEIDFSAEGQFEGESLLYIDAVPELSMSVPEAAFSAALSSGSLFLNSETDEVSISLNGSGELFQGRELISLEFVLYRIGGGLPFEELSNSSDFFDEAAVSRWSVTFTDTDGTSFSSGVEIGVLPEPSSYALCFGLVVVTLVATVRRVTITSA